MPPMPVYYVGKGTQFGVLDMFDGTDPSVYEAALERLDSEATLLELAEQRREAGGNLTETDIRHFDKDWLTTWWTKQHVALVLRAGIRKALEVALFENPDEPFESRSSRPSPLPVEALWVCADEDVFQVYVNEGPHQVTVIVYTPPPGSYAARARELAEKIWVVKVRDDYDGTLHGSDINRLTPEDAWPVLIERQLQYTDQTE